MMKNTPNRRAVGPAASVSRSNLSRIGRIVLGVLTLAIGGSLAGVMAIATVHEFLARDFYGVCVAGMVAVFGAQLVRIGYDSATGRRTMAVEPDPADKLWHSDKRVHPYRPYSQLEIKGR